MPITYEPIATTTLTSNTVITFSSIPSTYTDLRLVLFNTPSYAENRPIIYFNGDETSSYSRVTLQANGSSVQTVSNLNSSGVVSNSNTGPTAVGLYTFDIFGYTRSIFKTVIMNSSGEKGTSDSNLDFIVGSWRNTSVISSISLSATTTSTFANGTTATLYGIKAV